MRKCRFTTVDEATAEASGLLLREISQGRPIATGTESIGVMPEAADELGEIVADNMTRQREER